MGMVVLGGKDANKSQQGQLELALADPNAQRFIAGSEIKKTIIVPGRLVNIVV